MTNLNSENEEYRYATLADWNSVLAKNYTSGVYIMDDQREEGYVRHRNYILWARDYLYSKYNDSTIGDYNYTYNQIINMSSPSVSFQQVISEDVLNNILEQKFNISLEVQELEDQEVTLDAIDPDGNYTTVTVTTNITRTPVAVTKVSHVGGFDQELLGEAWIYEHGNEFTDGWFGYGIISGETCYSIGAGDNRVDSDEEDETDDGSTGNAGNEVAIEGESDDIWIYWGFEVTEVHADEVEDEDGNIVEGEEYTIDVFCDYEQTYVELPEWIETKVPGYNTTDTVFYILCGYVYYIDVINAYETDDDGYVILDSRGNPTIIEKEPEAGATSSEPEYETMTLIHHYSWDIMDGEGNDLTVNYTSEIDLNNIDFFSLVLNNEDALQDEVLAETTEEVVNENFLMSPPIVYKRNKSWITGTWWKAIFTKAEKKASGDSDTYDEMMESIQESATDDTIAWVYHMWALPTNMCQLEYCARYAIAFFQLHCISDYQVIRQNRETTNRYISGRNWTITATGNSTNYRLRYGFSGLRYLTGTGYCPVPGYSEVRRGEGGVTWYSAASAYTLWSQVYDDYWEAVAIAGYSLSFRDIKNGKSADVGSNGWTDSLWVTVDVKRNYSGALIPISKLVLSKIAIADATDVMQYSQYIGITTYKVVKIKWYYKVLKIVIIVIAVVLTVVSIIIPAFAPLAQSAWTISMVMDALLAIVYSVAIGIAVSYVLSEIIAPILVDLFGDVLGNILAAVIAIVASAMTGNSSIMDELLSAMNWLKIGLAAVNGYNQLLQNKLNTINAKMSALQTSIEAYETDIESAQASFLGNYQTMLSQTWYRTDSAYKVKNALDDCVVETGTAFLERTYIVGAEAAENSFQTLENYTEFLSEAGNYLSINFSS